MATNYESGAKLKVLEILKERPDLSYSVIANEVGVSRERVRQIAKSIGYPPRQKKLIQNKCKVCGKTFNSKHLYCSNECRIESTRKRILVNCYTCGRSIARTPGSMRSKSGEYFCCRSCYLIRMRKKD